jgi:hypothetical protein
MKFYTAALVFCMLTSPALAECLDASAYDVNEKPLPKKPDKEIEESVQVSAEGGGFEIYYNKSKKPERIVRTDFGESGRIIYTLSIGAKNNVMITAALHRYSVPFTEPGSVTIRIETDIYSYCDGKLEIPGGFDTTSDYYKSAKETADLFFAAPELQAEIKKSGVMPLTWQ